MKFCKTMTKRDQDVLSAYQKHGHDIQAIADEIGVQAVSVSQYIWKLRKMNKIPPSTKVIKAQHMSTSAITDAMETLAIVMKTRQLLLDSAVAEYSRLCPGGEELSVSAWCDLWHEITQPLELDVRAHMLECGCNIELWIGLED